MSEQRSVGRFVQFARARAVTVCALVASASLLALPPAAAAQATIRVGEDVTLRFGALVQGWADFTEDPVLEGYGQNVFLRRVRLLVGGQVARNVTFFIETDAPNLGRATGTAGKNLGGGFIVQDALVEMKLSDPFIISAGLMFVPFCRNCIQSAATLLSLDYSSWSFLAGGATQSSVGRDVGFQAKGYLGGNRFEYRVGAFQGFRAPLVPGTPGSVASRNPLRAVGRVQVNLLEPEAQGIFYTGTYLGTRRVLAIGGGVDMQAGPGDNYQALAVDAFLDLPLTPGSSVTAQVDFFRFDGGQTFAIPALAKQNAIFAEAGIYLKQPRILPFVKYETQSFSATADQVRDNARFQVGITKYISGHNANVKVAYSMLDPKTGDSANGVTAQLQLFYY
jgi:hypothetical protein